MRLHRRGFFDHAMTLLALKPWRCMRCRERFYARAVALELIHHAHCPKCGNFDVQNAESSAVAPGVVTTILRYLRASAYRCEDCELNFHSFALPYDTTADNLARE